MTLEVKNIRKKFDDKLVLDNISFELKKGEITGLVGRNGSGKTTILKIMSRILDPSSGTIAINVKDLFDYPDLIENIAYLPDRFDFFAYDTGKNAMEYYAIIYPGFNRDFVEKEARKLGLPLDKSIRSLSKGNKALLGLLIILATNADFLLLDEVLDGMDVLNKELIIKYLLDAVSNGRSILISSHQLDELQGITDNVLYLNLEGKIEGITQGRDMNIQKVQIVVKEELPQEILDEAILRLHLGRVYTVLLPGSEEEVVKKLVREEIVQFDILPLKIEDYFYWEKGKEKQ